MLDLNHKKAIITGFQDINIFKTIQFLNSNQIEFNAFDEDESLVPAGITFEKADLGEEINYKLMFEKLNQNLGNIQLFFIHIHLEDKLGFDLNKITRKLWLMLKYSIPFLAQGKEGSIIGVITAKGGNEMGKEEKEVISAISGLLRSVAVEASNLEVRINLIRIEGENPDDTQLNELLFFLCSEQGRLITGSENII